MRRRTFHIKNRTFKLHYTVYFSSFFQDDVIEWMKNIFRFQSKTINGFRDPRQPILKAIRCAISVKFGQDAAQRERGFENFFAPDGTKKYPIIYITDDVPESWINYYQTQLNLPLSCFFIHRIRQRLLQNLS